VTIAWILRSVTDNAQSIYELSEVENHAGVAEVSEKKFGFQSRQFEKPRTTWKENDGAGNTFRRPPSRCSSARPWWAPPP